MAGCGLEPIGSVSVSRKYVTLIAFIQFQRAREYSVSVAFHINTFLTVISLNKVLNG